MLALLGLRLAMMTTYILSGVIGVGLALAASGCVVKDTAIDGSFIQTADHGMVVGDPDFNWHLSGDRRVAPRQVFSDASHIWLQWHPHQSIPTVFAQSGVHWQVLDLRMQGQYAIVDGQWQVLRFQGAQLQAHAHRRIRSDCPPGPSSAPPPSARQFELRISDRTIRQALNRWALENNWYFDDAHWTLPVDLPVTAPARFSGDFAAAVEQLLQAVEGAGRPARPCFYANHVLRVIPKTASCEPGQTPGDKAFEVKP